MDNGINNETEELYESETLCNFKKYYSSSPEFITDLMLQSDMMVKNFITSSDSDNVIFSNKKQTDFTDEQIGPWPQNSLNMWSTGCVKKCSKFVQDEMLDSVKKKKRSRECDRLDLSLDYTACVNTETFQYQPNSCFYSKFKAMIRNVSNQNKKIRMNGFSQNIKERLKTRAAVVTECNDEKPEAKLTFHVMLDESEDGNVASHADTNQLSTIQLRQTQSKPNPSKKSNSSTKVTNSAPVSATTQSKTGRANDHSVERHKPNSGLNERILTRDRLKDNLITRTTFPYVVEQTVNLPCKGISKTSPSIPSKNSALISPNSNISCFGKSLLTSNVLPPIGQKTQNCKFVNRKK